jgi:MORN repeat
LDGKKHGLGEQVWPNGEYYWGNFEYGNISGEGVFVSEFDCCIGKWDLNEVDGHRVEIKPK